MSRRSKLKTDDPQKPLLRTGKDTKIPLTCMIKAKHTITIQDRNEISSEHARLFCEVSSLLIKLTQNKADEEGNKLIEPYVKIIVEKQLPSSQIQFNVIDKISKIFTLLKEDNHHQKILQNWIQYLQKVCAYLQHQVVMTGRQHDRQMFAINCLRLRTMYLKCINLELSDVHSAFEEGIKILQYAVANYQYQQIAKYSNYLQWIQTHIISLLRCLQFLNSLAQVDCHSIINKLCHIYISYLNQHVFTIQILQLLQALSSFESQKQDFLLFLINSFNPHLNINQAQILILILCHHAKDKIATQGWKKWLSYFWCLCDKNIDCEQLLSTLSTYVNVEVSQIFTTILAESNQMQNHVNSLQNTYLDNAMHHLLQKSSKTSWQLALMVSLRINKLLKCIYSKSRDSQLSANLLLFLQKQIISKVYFGAQQYQIIYQTCRRYVSIKLLSQIYEFVPKFVSQCQSVILLQKSFDQLCQTIENIVIPMFIKNQVKQCLININLILKLMQNNEKIEKERVRHTKLCNILLRTSNMQRDQELANKCSQKLIKSCVRVGKPLHLQKQLLQIVTLVILNKNINKKQSIYTQLMQTVAFIQDPRFNQQQNFIFNFNNASLSHICQLNIQLHLLVPFSSKQPSVIEEHKLWLARLKAQYLMQIQAAPLNDETNNARIGLIVFGLLNKLKNPQQMISDCEMQEECCEKSQINMILDEMKILIQLLENLNHRDSFIHPMCKANTKIHQSDYNLNEAQASSVDQEIRQQIILQFIQQINWQINALLAIIVSYCHLGSLLNSLSMSFEESIQFQIFELAATMFRGVKQLINKVCYTSLAQNKIKQWLSNNLKFPILLSLDHFLLTSSHSNRNLSNIIEAVQGNFTNYEHLRYLPQVNQMNKHISSILIGFAQYKGIQGLQRFISQPSIQTVQETAQIVKIQGKIRIIRKVKKEAE